MKTEIITLGIVSGFALAFFCSSPSPKEHSGTKTLPANVVHLYPFGQGASFDTIGPANGTVALSKNGSWDDSSEKAMPAVTFVSQISDAAQTEDAATVTIPETEAAPNRALTRAVRAAVAIEIPPNAPNEPKVTNSNPYVVIGAPPLVLSQGRCPKGQVECANDACINTQTDPNNCGECGLVCPNAHSSGVTCRGGLCRAGACDAGWANCDDRSDCETDITTANHCGSCFSSCPTISINGRPQRLTCVNGACQAPTDLTQCGNAYVDLSSTPAHCGACGHACGDGQNCVNGTCVCADVRKCDAQI